LIRTALLILLMLPAFAAHAEQEIDYRRQLVKSYGMDQIDQVEAIRFTYNYQRGEMRMGRSWVWEPNSNRVTLTGSLDGDAKVAFDLDEIDDSSPQALRDLAERFRWDTQATFLPLWIARTEGAKIENGGYKLAPLGKIVARELIVTMPGKKGNVYRLYVDENWRINQWHAEYGEEGNLPFKAIWATDEQAGPLLLCTRFRNPKTKEHLWYADVAVKTKGVAHWQIAKTVDHRCRTCP
jgi:hypothetical protein